MKRALLVAALLLVPTGAWAADVQAKKTSNSTSGGYAVYHMCVSQTTQAICLTGGKNIILNFNTEGYNKAVTLFFDSTSSTAASYSCIVNSSSSGSASTLVGVIGAAMTQLATQESVSGGLPPIIWVDCSAAAIVGGVVNIDVTVAPNTPGMQ